MVLTSVDRDDLQDGGSAHIAETVRFIKREKPEMMVEVGAAMTAYVALPCRCCTVKSYADKITLNCRSFPLTSRARQPA